MGAFKNFKAEYLGAGVSLKPQHYQDVLALLSNSASPVGNSIASQQWFEVHTENYFVDGGPRLEYLNAIREHFPISFHGVGASLGGLTLPNKDHLKKVKKLVDRFEPTLISEHAVWSAYSGTYFADLLPILKTKDALNQLVDGIDCYQNAIGQKILIENPSNYLSFKSELDEPDFLLEASQRSGCGLLIDVNNLYLSEQNCGLNVDDYLKRIPPERVGEIHIAGHDVDPNLGKKLLIDSHAAEVAQPVWQLLQQALQLFGKKPVLLERDNKIPKFEQLLLEQNKAQNMISRAIVRTHHASLNTVNS
jgi:hypothetical protein